MAADPPRLDAVTMNLTFLYPQAGWLALLLPVLWSTARRPIRWAHVFFRCAVFGCLILALMQPSLIHRRGGAAQVFVLDQRPEIGAEERARARVVMAALLSRSSDGRRTLVQIGGAPVVARVQARTLVSDGSLATALTRALEAIPAGEGGRIALIADARSTDRHWEHAIDALIRRGIRVDTVALAVPDRAAFIGDATVSPARVGELVRVRVEVEGDGRDHFVTMSSDARRLAVSAPIRAQGPTTVVLTAPADRAGFMPLRLTLSGVVGGVDTEAAVQDPLPMLYLGGRQVGAAAKLQKLMGPGVAVTPRAADALAPGFDFARFPLVFLDDLPAAQLGVPLQAGLAGAIENDGVGLLAAGGQAAFGVGGYANGPIASALPVRARQDEKVEQPTVALAIVIDTSGSMGGPSLDLAKQVARQTVRKLKSSDHVGVVEFYGARQWAVPMQLARQIPDVERAIARMQAQGGTTLFPALEEAYYGLKDIDARYRHILVISDGGVEDDRYQQLLRHVADDRITVSTVQVGSDPSGEKSMAEWARIGRGRFYSVPDDFGLVAIDFRQPQTKPEPGYRSGLYPLAPAAASTWWQGTRMETMPPLEGYARVAVRPQADMLLATASGDPVLSSWQYGIGRVTALATEPVGDGTRRWRGWPDYGRWLARIAVMTARQSPDMVVTTRRRFDRMRIVVQRFGAASSVTPAIRLLASDGRTLRTVDNAVARAPGLFVADIPYPASRPALVEARDGDRVARAADPAFSDVSALGVVPPEKALPLAALAAATSGDASENAVPRAIPSASLGHAFAAVDLWPFLALLALALYVAEIIWRRWPTNGIPSLPRLRSRL